MRACPQCLTVYETDPEFCSFDGHRLDSFKDGDPLIGKTLGDLRIEARLGTGGTGVVYRATQLATELPCAVKLLFGEMATDKQMAERFDREAQAASRISHPNVVRIIDHVRQSSGVTYLVMDYVEGRTLKEIVDDEAPLDPQRVTSMASQLAAGLAAAHKQGYVHRDLKPGNVMVSSSTPETLKILDFGIVASLQAADSKERLTKTGFIVGTPTYMAPEQIDPRMVSPQIDVYALGVILYELLTGEPPFVGTLEQILVAKMTSQPKPLPATVGELGDLVLELLATAPDDRPATALHVCVALGAASLDPDDPSTVRAEIPDLYTLEQVGFQQGTIRFGDDTDSDPNNPAADPIPSATEVDFGDTSNDTDETREPVSNQEEERWRADTTLTPAADARLPSFRGDDPTTASPRRVPSVPRLSPASLDEATVDQAAWDQDEAEEEPTRLSEHPSRSASGRSSPTAIAMGNSSLYDDSGDDTNVEYDPLVQPLGTSESDPDGLDYVAETYVRPAFPSDDLPALRSPSVAGPTLLGPEHPERAETQDSVTQDEPFESATVEGAVEDFLPTSPPSASTSSPDPLPVTSPSMSSSDPGRRTGVIVGLALAAVVAVVLTAAYLALSNTETVIVDVPQGMGRVVE